VRPPMSQCGVASSKETVTSPPGSRPMTVVRPVRLDSVHIRSGTMSATVRVDASLRWLIGGRTGGGKTVFLLDVLYGLATRYSPEELELYLLDFKEGVSFTEFTPSAVDESWIPHVKAVGVESDREYGAAVLQALRGELSRRAGMMKRAGATRLARLRELRPDVRLPRIVAVVDEFHVLFSGNDRLAREAVAHLEELARKGRSYGVHLVLASQTISGIEALYSKKDSIFGQFPLRVALPGAKHLLADDNDAAESEPALFPPPPPPRTSWRRCGGACGSGASPTPNRWSSAASTSSTWPTTRAMRPWSRTRPRGRCWAAPWT
jgi:hypothetical protein